MAYPQKEEKRNVFIIKAASSYDYDYDYDDGCLLSLCCLGLYALASCLELYALSIAFGYVLLAMPEAMLLAMLWALLFLVT